MRGSIFGSLPKLGTRWPWQTWSIVVITLETLRTNAYSKLLHWSCGSWIPSFDPTILNGTTTVTDKWWEEVRYRSLLEVYRVSSLTARSMSRLFDIALLLIHHRVLMHPSIHFMTIVETNVGPHITTIAACLDDFAGFSRPKKLKRRMFQQAPATFIIGHKS